jgi:DNA-binding NtrC family response regulator
VKRGGFREDLFFRINVFPVTIPPLRARREDIDALIDFFLQRFEREIARPGLRISADAREAMRAYDWPGNIRELQNCIERATILCDRNTIEMRDLGLSSSSSASDSLREAVDLSGTIEEASQRAVRIIERMKIEDALKNAPNRNAAAELLGLSSRVLATKMREYGIE